MLSFLILFRETLEAALVVGIVLALLSKTGNLSYRKYVYLGTAAGIVASLVTALIFVMISGGFEGRAEEIFEGTTMLLGAALLTTMIFWMMRTDHKKAIQERVSRSIESKSALGIFLLIFFSILREGVESVIFLGAVSFSSQSSLFFALGGIAAALLLAYFVFMTSLKVNIRTFFSYSSVLLLLIAAGLVAHGVHELQEASVLPTIIEHVWDINPEAPQAELGIYPLLHEDGLLGSLGKSLFGYNGNPSLLEVLAYTFYLLGAGYHLRKSFYFSYS